MKFGEKLRELRIKNHMTQTVLSDKLGVSLRTLQNYETCNIYPKQSEIYGKIAELFGVSTDYLLKDEASDSIQQPEDLDALVAQVGSLFSGGKLSEEGKDKVLYTITELYWKAKSENKKKQV